MTNEEREIDLNIADLEAEIRRLKKIESSARLVMKAFSNSIDYDSWDKALDALEVVLKEKP
jgi:hypothetical protein